MIPFSNKKTQKKEQCHIWVSDSNGIEMLVTQTNTVAVMKGHSYTISLGTSLFNEKVQSSLNIKNALFYSSKV